LARDIQRDPVTDLPLHVDFIPYNPKSIIHVNVSVRVEGEEQSPGIKIGGVLQLIESQIEVICRADSIPEEIVVSVAGLDIGESIHLSSITLPEGVKPAVTDRDLTIVSVVSTRTSNTAEDEAADAATAEAASAASEEEKKTEDKA
ncbi:MAG: 50S ribosomal protein L25, partial [Alphaproteobacteria bacterium]